MGFNSGFKGLMRSCSGQMRLDGAEAVTKYRVIRIDCRGFNNSSHTIHL